jgi:hypothetical protein
VGIGGNAARRAARRPATSTVNELTRLQSAVVDGKVPHERGVDETGRPDAQTRHGGLGLATVG